jgi:hypothetical protein
VSIGTCAVGLISEPHSGPSRAERHQLCADLEHPGATYNPWQDQTWCLCGTSIRAGDHHAHAACCGGPLSVARGDGDAS